MLSSIAYEMSVQAKGLLNEASDAPAIKQAIIIGGMGRSKTFQAALHVFLLEFITGLQVNVIDKPRPLDTQAALLGAMNELLVADNDYPDIAAAIAGRIPLKPCINPADLSFLSMQDGFTKIE